MVIFNEAKPKYEKLDELLDSYLNDIRFSNSVNIIVDLKEVFRKFFRPDITLENYTWKALIEEISSDIINIVGHYRNYFYKKGKYSNFYFLYSKTKSAKLLEENPDYKKEYYEKYFNENDDKTKIMSKVALVVEKVLNAIPHCIFLDTSKFDELVYLKYILSSVRENEMTILLTNDDLLFQCLSKNVFGLNIKGIKSQLLTTKNCIEILTKKEEYNFSSNMIPLLLSISGSKKNSLDSIPSFGLLKASNIIKKLLEEDKLIDSDSVKFPIEFSKLNENNKMEKMLIDNREKLIKNYNFIRQDEMLYSNKLVISNDFIKRPKDGSASFFADLNAKIFSMFPLQIEMILKGEHL